MTTIDDIMEEGRRRARGAPRLPTHIPLVEPPDGGMALAAEAPDDEANQRVYERAREGATHNLRPMRDASPESSAPPDLAGGDLVRGPMAYREASQALRSSAPQPADTRWIDDIGKKPAPAAPTPKTIDVMRSLMPGAIARTGTPTSIPSAPDDTQAPHATQSAPPAPEPQAFAELPPDELPAPPMPPDEPPAVANAKAPATGAGGDVSPAPASREAQLRAAIENARSSRDPFAATASRLIEDMRTARTGGPRNYSAAKAIEAGDAAAQAAPIRAYQVGAAADKNALDREKTLAEIAKTRAETAATGVKTAALPLPESMKSAPPDPTKQKLAETNLALAETRLKNAQNPKPAGLTPAAEATDERMTGQRRDVNKQTLSKLSAAQTGLADSIEELEKVAPGILGGDTSKMPGKIDSALASSWLTRGFSSEQAQAVNALKARVKQLVSLDVSGKVLNGTELKNMEAFLGLDPFTDPKVFAHSLGLVLEGLKHSVATRDAAFGKTGGPEDRFAVLDEMRAADPGMLSATHPVFGHGGATRPQAAPRRETRTLKNGETVNVEQQPDGTWKEVE